MESIISFLRVAGVTPIWIFILVVLLILLLCSFQKWNDTKISISKKIDERTWVTLTEEKNRR